jgi:hypothetical protein
MKIDSYKNDPLFLVERKILESRKILSESCEGLNLEQRAIVEGIYNEFEPLIRKVSLLEQTLTADQIKQLFTSVEQGATAAGGNRTMLGKGKDVATKANEIINNVGKWLQNTTPVQAFDQKFEDLKAGIKEKLGGDDSAIVGGLQKLGELAKENPGKTAAIVGILTAIASVAGGPVGGAIAGQVLRGSVELLKGEKLSTAVGKGIKTAALGYLSGKAFEIIGKAMGSMRLDSMTLAGAEEAGLEEVSFRATQTLRGWGQEMKTTLQGFKVAVFPQEAEAINAAITAIQNGEPGAFDTLQALAREINSADYQDAMTDIIGAARSNQIANDSLMNWIKGTATAGQALSQGAVAGAGVAADGEKKPPAAPTEALQYNLRPLTEAQCGLLFSKISRLNHQMITEGMIWEQGEEPEGQKPSFMQRVMGKAGEIGKNLTTKTTASKLMAAWKKAGSPADSDAIADLLKQQGVNDQVVAQTFSDMKLPKPGSGKTMAEIAAIKKEIAQLDPENSKKLMGLLTQQAGATA